MCPSSGMQEQIRVLSHPFPGPSRPLSASRDSCLSRHELPAADGVCSTRVQHHHYSLLCNLQTSHSIPSKCKGPCRCAGLVLRIFLLILPLILRAMTKQEGVIDQGVLDHRVTTKYFIFQVRP